jgi:2,5-dihydroxypyridine 5,6-dioxygenase
MISWQYRDSIGATSDLIPLFKSVLEHCKLHPGEQMLVYADHHTPRHYAAAFLAAGQQLGATVLQITIPTQQPDITEGAVWDAWHNVDLVIDLESISTSVYRPLRVSALAGGTRVLRVTEPEDVLFRLPPDPVVRDRALRSEALVTAAKEFHITSAAGTDITVNIDGLRSHGMWGVADQPGMWDHWPIGLVVVAANRAGTNGKIVIDVGDILLAMQHYVTSPITVTVEEGIIKSIEGGVDAAMLRQYFESGHDPRAYEIAHVGWGCDHRADWNRLARKIPGGTDDAESFLGDLQIAFGRDTSPLLRGTNDVKTHMDFDCLNVNIDLDGRKIIEQSQFVLDELK